MRLNVEELYTYTVLLYLFPFRCVTKTLHVNFKMQNTLHFIICGLVQWTLLLFSDYSPFCVCIVPYRNKINIVADLPNLYTKPTWSYM